MIMKGPGSAAASTCLIYDERGYTGRHTRPPASARVPDGSRQSGHRPDWPPSQVKETLVDRECPLAGLPDSNPRMTKRLVRRPLADPGGRIVYRGTVRRRRNPRETLGDAS